MKTGAATFNGNPDNLDERRVAVAEAIGYTGIEVLSNDKRALSLQRVPF